MLNEELTQADYKAINEAMDFYLDYLRGVENIAFKMTSDTTALANFVRKSESIRRVQNRLYEISLLN